MAFQSAAGYGNLPNGAFSPVIYSQKVQMQFRKESVCADITNNDYFGEISGFGDSVKIIKEPEITVTSHARGKKLTSQNLEDSDFTLLIDRANSVQFRVDDIETLHSHVNWEDMARDRAAYRLRDTYDRDCLGYMSGYEYDESTETWSARTSAVGTKAESTADADELLAAHKMDREDFGGAAGDSIAVGVSGTFDVSPVNLLNRMVYKLNIKNVESNNRWAVVDPKFIEILMSEDSKFMDSDFQSSEQLENGMISAGRVRGFRVYMSNNLPALGTGPSTADTNGSNTNYGIISVGHDSAVATAEQIDKFEKLRDQDSFGDIIRGLHLYGRKILRPEGLVRAAYNSNV